MSTDTISQFANDLLSALNAFKDDTVTTDVNTSIASISEQIAELSKQESNRSVIGKSGILKTLSQLLPFIQHDAATLIQCLRAIANTCIDDGKLNY
jgi:hypothetical protein